MTEPNINAMPEEAFVQLGGGEIAYIRPVMSEEVDSLFPGAPSLQPGMRLWALLNADGTPIVLTDSHAAAVANAHEHDLETVSVH
jgi:hypothetical protein